MARPVSIKTDAILGAARKVFLQQGYQASTVEVAREAGVSEGTLFKRFATKSNLFMAAMDASPEDVSWEEDLLRSAGAGDLRETLESAGRRILEHMQVILPQVMMIRAHGIVLRHPGRNSDGTPHPIHRVRVLAGYFRAEVQQGRLVMENPEVQAQLFIGALTHYVFQDTVFGYRSVAPLAYVRTLVDMVLRAGDPGPADRAAVGVRGRVKGLRRGGCPARSGGRGVPS